jgi:uncharacterized repeat protein (TIGR03847 family)
MTYFHYDFDPADFFTVGTLGQPGQRTFILQAGRGIEYVSMACEKEQVAALGEGLLSMLDQIEEMVNLKASGTVGEDAFGLVEPVIPVWRIAQIGVGYDGDVDRVIIVVQEMTAEIGDAELGRFTIGRAHAEAFALHALNVVAAGQPLCPVCGEPMEPEGHWCVKTNGHGKPYVQ